MLGLLERNATFFDAFETISAHAVGAVASLVELSKRWPECKENIRAIREHERQADEIAHVALAQLDRTFQTPLYREEIHALIHTLDSVIDTIKAAAERFEVFHLVRPYPALAQQAEVLGGAIGAVEKAVRVLRTNRKLEALRDHLIAVHELENNANDIYETTMAELFGAPRDALSVLKQKELHELMLRATDECEDVANILERIALQSA